MVKILLPVLSPELAPLVDTVKRFYSRFPYPNYPLFAKPAWQDGYLTHSQFARCLAQDLSLGVARATSERSPWAIYGKALPFHREVLIAGSGEILPFVMRRWERRDHRVVAIDLSARSLRRARFRLLLSSLKPSEFVNQDLDHYLETSLAMATLDHVEAYGVLHHMANPSKTLKRLFRTLKPGGTLRLMVYNSISRQWIFHLQRLFADLGVDVFAPEDVKRAIELLKSLVEKMPELGHKMRGMMPNIFHNPVRFADTFLHVREARLSPGSWQESASAAGFQSMGLFDRYGELDDLPNPLWHTPDLKQIGIRAQSGKFDNNLELFLIKPKGVIPGGGGQSLSIPGSLLCKRPPRIWFQFHETKCISHLERRLIWHAHLKWLYQSRLSHDRALTGLAPSAVKRLARLGALFPGQCQVLGLKVIADQPFSEDVESDNLPASSTSLRIDASQQLTKILHDKNLFSKRRLGISEARLKRLADCLAGQGS
jgi:SAM-dependent methyltransferase